MLLCKVKFIAILDKHAALGMWKYICTVYGCITLYVRTFLLHNYCFILVQDARKLFTTLPAARMGMMTNSALKMNWLIKTEKLTPLVGQGLIPLCSTQYKLLFGTTRIPGRTMGMESYTGVRSYMLHIIMVL